MNVDICVATKNSVNTLPKLLQSINAQVKKINSRFIVADGSSSDRTIEYLSKFSFCKIISYADNSPEEGINKLLKFEPISNLKILVGSDELLSEEYLLTFKKEADKLLKKGINKFILIPKFYKNIGSNFLKLDFPVPLFFLDFIGICRGIGWGIYSEKGDIPLFNESFEIASDYEFLLNCKKQNYYFKYVPCRYFHLKTGRSSLNWKVGLKEERKIGLSYNKNIFFRMLINLLYSLKFAYKILNKFIQKI